MQSRKRAIYGLILYYGASLFMVGFYQYSGFISESYSSLIAFDVVISLFTLAFAYEQRAYLKPLLNFRRIQWKPLLLLLLLVAVMALAVSGLSEYLDEAIHHRKHQVSFIFWETSYPRLLTVIFICLQPAIFEELAYRGLVYGYIEGFTLSAKWAIIGSATLFSALHFSLIGWLWLMPLGILLAYYRYKHQNLWYGAFAHFLYNFIVVWWEWV